MRGSNMKLTVSRAVLDDAPRDRHSRATAAHLDSSSPGRVRRLPAWPMIALCFSIAATALFVGQRPIDIGSDTANYVAFYTSLDSRFIESRFEPGFFAFSWITHRLGFSANGFLTLTFLLMNAAWFLSIMSAAKLLDLDDRRIVLACATFSCLFVSPVYLSASINVLRHGIAAPLAFASLLAIQRRAWVRGIILGAVGGAFHASTWLFLSTAPLFRFRLARRVAFVALPILYLFGATRTLVRASAPAIFNAVSSYGAYSDYRIGVRFDFAIFTIAVFFLIFVASRLLLPKGRQAISSCLQVLISLSLPFFAFGWGAFSDRFLFPVWLSASFVMGLFATLAMGHLPHFRILSTAGTMLGAVYFVVQVAS